jgi:hypothetical protein
METLPAHAGQHGDAGQRTSGAQPVQRNRPGKV